VSTKLEHEAYQRLKKASIKSGCTRYRFVQKAIEEKLQDYDRELSMNEALTTEEERFTQELYAIKTKLLSYANIVSDTCPKCGELWVEHDLEQIIGFVWNVARERFGDKQCKNCGKPLAEHDFDTILWALHTYE